MTADNSAAGGQPSPLPVIIQAPPAPYCYYPARVDGYPISVFVRHNTVGRNSLPWFLSQASGVSIHHLVNRDGSRTDMVRRNQIAFHVGASRYLQWVGSLSLPAAPMWPQGAEIAMLNAVSLGMELESRADLLPWDRYTDAMLWTAAYTEACAIVSYSGLTVVDHKLVALPPGRRRDPAWFPYKVYLPRVAAWVNFLKSTPPSEAAHWFL